MRSTCARKGRKGRSIRKSGKGRERKEGGQREMKRKGDVRREERGVRNERDSSASLICLGDMHQGDRA